MFRQHPHCFLADLELFARSVARYTPLSKPKSPQKSVATVNE